MFYRTKTSLAHLYNYVQYDMSISIVLLKENVTHCDIVASCLVRKKTQCQKSYHATFYL